MDGLDRRFSFLFPMSGVKIDEVTSLDFFELLKAIFFGIIQGITEWLPISSTGHMILADEFMQLKEVTPGFINTFLVVIQFGSILAVIVMFFHKLNPFSPKKSLVQKKETFSLWGKVLVAVVPAAIIGFLFEDQIHEWLYNPTVIAIALIVYGVLFIVLELNKKKARVENFSQLTYQMALFIGVFQVLALIPGTSRSGATILGAIILGTSRYVAAEFSFFLAIPTMLGASGYELLKSGLSYTGSEWAVMIVGTVVSFVVSVFAIKFLMNFIKKHDFKAFGYYRIVLGIAVLL